MKALCLVTFADCDNKVKSLEAAGFAVETRQYDKSYFHGHMAIVDEAKNRIKPDFIVYIGAIPGPVHSVPTFGIFRQFRKIAPLIHMCNDAGDAPWWPYLKAYNEEDCFDVQVAIDGSSSPINTFKNGIALLTPIDCRPFEPKPWNERTTNMAMSSNAIGHGARGRVVQGLIDRRILTFRKGTNELHSYEDYAQFLCNSKIVFNHPMTGSGDYQHVKGRVVEAGFAGACLLERKGSPTSTWLLPGIDYLEYEDNDPDAVVALMTNAGDTILQQTAHNLHERVVRIHHPKVFWNAVLAKAGLPKEI